MMGLARECVSLKNQSDDCRCVEEMRSRPAANDELPSTRMLSSGGTVLARFSLGASSIVGVVALRFVTESVAPFMPVAPFT